MIYRKKTYMPVLAYLLLVVLFVTFSITSFTGVSAQDTYWSNNAIALNVGNGDSDNPYQISSAGQLYEWISTKGSNGLTYAELVADLDLSEHVWNLNDGISGRSYYLDGKGHSINGLKFSSGNSKAGLFGHDVTKLEVSSLSVNCNTTQSAGGYFGVFAANVSGELNLSKCLVQGSITINSNSVIAGGFIGNTNLTKDGTIQNCINLANIKANGGTIGGIVGDTTKGSKSNIFLCANQGSITAASKLSIIGGIVGNDKNNTIEKCYNSGALTAQKGDASVVGGIVGQLQSARTISNCYNTASVTSAGYAGGICGFLGSDELKLTYCYNIGAVTASVGADPTYESTTSTVCDFSANSQRDIVTPYDSGGGGSNVVTYQLKFNNIKALKSLPNNSMCGTSNDERDKSYSIASIASSSANIKVLEGSAEFIATSSGESKSTSLGSFSIDLNGNITGGSYLSNNEMVYKGTYSEDRYTEWQYKTNLLKYNQDVLLKTETSDGISASEGSYGEKQTIKYYFKGAGIAVDTQKRGIVLGSYIHVTIETKNKQTLSYNYVGKMKDISYPKITVYGSTSADDIKKEFSVNANKYTAYTTDSNINNGYPILKDFYWNYATV